MLLEKLTGRHYLFFVVCLTIISIKAYPGMIIERAGRDSWVFVLAAGLVLLLLGSVITGAFARKKIPDINHLYLKAFGKYTGELMLLLFALALFLNGCESISVLSSIIHTNMFIQTPVWFGLLFFAVPGIYILSKGFDSLLKLVLLSVFLMLISIILLIIMEIPYNHFSYALPALQSPLNYRKVLGWVAAFGSMSSLGISFPYLSRMAERSSLRKYFIISAAISFIVAAYSMLSIVATFGETRAANLFFPEFIQAQRISYGDYIESGELFSLIQNFFGFMVKYLLSLFGIYIIYKDKIMNTFRFFLILSVTVFIFSFIITGSTYILMYRLYWLAIINIVFLLLIPLISVIVFNGRNISSKQ